MAQQERRSGRPGPARHDESPDKRGQAAVTAKGEKLKEVIDEVLEDIDDALEENTEEFVKSYVQRGGE